MRTILEAAERVYSANSAASIEQVAEAAGVARATVHRRFATRDALLSALTEWAEDRLHEAVDLANPESAPPMVALYQLTANVLRVKIGWRFSMRMAALSPTTAPRRDDLMARCEALLRRAQDAGMVRPEVDIPYARRVYQALVDEAMHGDGTENPEALATAIVHTLLHGIGSSTAQL